MRGGRRKTSCLQQRNSKQIKCKDILYLKQISIQFKYDMYFVLPSYCQLNKITRNDQTMVFYKANNYRQIRNCVPVVIRTFENGIFHRNYHGGFVLCVRFFSTNIYYCGEKVFLLFCQKNMHNTYNESKKMCTASEQFFLLLFFEF